MEWTIDYDKFDKNPINTKNGQRNFKTKRKISN